MRVKLPGSTNKVSVKKGSLSSPSVPATSKGNMISDTSPVGDKGFAKGGLASPKKEKNASKNAIKKFATKVAIKQGTSRGR